MRSTFNQERHDQEGWNTCFNGQGMTFSILQKSFRHTHSQLLCLLNTIRTNKHFLQFGISMPGQMWPGLDHQQARLVCSLQAIHNRDQQMPICWSVLRRHCPFTICRIRSTMKSPLDTPMRVWYLSRRPVRNTRFSLAPYSPGWLVSLD